MEPSTLVARGRAKQVALNTPQRKHVHGHQVSHVVDGAEGKEVIARWDTSMPQLVRGTAIVDGGGDTSFRHITGVIHRLRPKSLVLPSVAPRSSTTVLSRSRPKTRSMTPLYWGVHEGALMTDAGLVEEGLERPGNLRSAVRANDANLKV